MNTNINRGVGVALAIILLLNWLAIYQLPVALIFFFALWLFGIIFSLLLPDTTATSWNH